MDPFPQDTQADLAGGHIFHQVKDIVISEKVSGLECRGLHSLAESVAILQRNAQQVAGSTNCSRCRNNFV